MDRYEVGDKNGVEGHYAKISQAQIASSALGVGSYIYDRMAHQKCPELWMLAAPRFWQVMRYKPARG